MAFAIVKIEKGAKCNQDRKFYIWPPSQYEGGSEFAGVSDGCVFIASKGEGLFASNSGWDCKADGAGAIGEKGRYGNGSIFADDVKLLTPMLGYEPDLSDIPTLVEKYAR